MPNRDGTGPQGKGPMTGRKMGNCEGGKNVPFESGKGKICGKGERRGTGERWNTTDEKEEKTNEKKD